MKINNRNNWVAVGALVAAVVISGSIVASAETTSEISFPVAELGNCGSKNECRAYCNDPAHMEVCITFAKAHGLMNKEEADRASQFKKTLQDGGGPGGCTTPAACKSFCEQIENIDACIAFAKKHGVSDKEVENGAKVRDYLKAGGTMPGGCTSRESCESYCGEFAHAKECAVFGQKIGGKPGEKQENFEKLQSLLSNGETPGHCVSKDDCEAYCKDQSHLEECTAFGEKAGFIKPEEGEKIRQFKAEGGPGGCNSKESCEVYCNQDANREECMTFAKEHGISRPSDRDEGAESDRSNRPLQNPQPQLDRAYVPGKYGPDRNGATSSDPGNQKQPRFIGPPVREMETCLSNGVSKEECIKKIQNNDQQVESQGNTSHQSAPCAGSPFPQDCMKAFMQMPARELDRKKQAGDETESMIQKPPEGMMRPPENMPGNFQPPSPFRGSNEGQPPSSGNQSLPPLQKPQGAKSSPWFVGAVLNILGKFLGLQTEVVTQ